MISQALDQFANSLPPRVNFTIAQAVDATSRFYSLAALQFQDESLQVPLGTISSTANHIRLLLEGDTTNDIFFMFGPDNTATIDDTKTNPAGTAWSGFTAVATPATNAPPSRLVANTTQIVRIDRQVDLFLYLKCASTKTGTIRIHQLAQSDVGATRGQ